MVVRLLVRQISDTPELCSVLLRRIFDCGVSVFVLSVGFWAGDGRSGTLMQDDDGTYAETKSIGGCPAIPYTHALGDLPASRASLRGDIRSPQQRSTAERDGIRLEVNIGGAESAASDYVGAA